MAQSTSDLGHIITFYSYKGGTGRTMALANCATLIARDGSNDLRASARRVLAIDWDLEAPGLHWYFDPYLPKPDPKAADAMGGVLELFEYVSALRTKHKDVASSRKALEQNITRWLTANIVDTTIPGLCFLKAGCFNELYAERISKFDWRGLYQQRPEVFDALADSLSNTFQFTLIDSRTGASDTANICTVLLPDKLAVIFTPNSQSLTGIGDLARKVVSYRHASDDWRPIAIYPIPSRIEMSRPRLAEQWRFGDRVGESIPAAVGYQKYFQEMFTELYDLDDCDLTDYFDQIQIQHVQDYSFGEQIAAELETGRTRLFLKATYEQLVQHLLELPTAWTPINIARADAQSRAELKSSQSCTESQDADGAIRHLIAAIELLDHSSGQHAGDLVQTIAAATHQFASTNHDQFSALIGSAANALVRKPWDTTLELAELTRKLAACAAEHKMVDLAKQLALESEKAIPSEPLDLRAALLFSSVGDILLDLQDLEHARTLKERALEIRRSVLGPDHPETWVLSSDLARVLTAQGDLAGAESLQRSVMDATSRLKGDTAPETASAMAELATILRTTGMWHETRGLIERALAIRRQVLGPRHPTTVATIASLQDLSREESEFDITVPSHTRQLENLRFTNVDVSRISHRSPTKLIGRDRELRLLDHYLKMMASDLPQRPRVVNIVGLGGSGKTALVSEWARVVGSQGWRGCESAFGWSFYSTAAEGSLTTSADRFFNTALSFFTGDASPWGSSASYDKGRELAKIIGNQRTLLILDGLESLQHRPGTRHGGMLSDEGISALLRNLSANSRGLCITTSRMPIADLSPPGIQRAAEVQLSRLSAKAGRELLRRSGVGGNERRIAHLVAQTNGHPLTLSLLGAYVRDAYDGVVEQFDLSHLIESGIGNEGRTVTLALDAYVKWLVRSGQGLAVQLAGVLSLFDRTTSKQDWFLFEQPPVIENVNEDLQGISPEKRLRAVRTLEAAGIARLILDDTGNVQGAEMHPLIREYFAHHLGSKNPESRRRAHQRIYEDLCRTTIDREQPTLEDLQPLYQAVRHGCKAGLHQDVCTQVYLKRILRGTGSGGYYSVRRLGAFGADLSAVGEFFDVRWSHVSPNLSPSHQAWILNEAATRLTGLGRVSEALEAVRTSVEMCIQQDDTRSAGMVAANLCETEVASGQISDAIESGERAVQYARRAKDAFSEIVALSGLADARHQAGEEQAARELFAQAEGIQRAGAREHDLLYSVRGFRYCDLLLSGAERMAWGVGSGQQSRETAGQSDSIVRVCTETIERCRRTIEWATSQRWLSDIALDHLSIARAHLYGALVKREESVDLSSANRHVTDAMEFCQRSGELVHLPRILCTRAWIRALMDSHEEARHDLDEAWKIAEGGPMVLHLTDIHLYRSRFFGSVDQYPWRSWHHDNQRTPSTDLLAAEQLVKQHGYLRRREQIQTTARLISR